MEKFCHCIKSYMYMHAPFCHEKAMIVYILTKYVGNFSEICFKVSLNFFNLNRFCVFLIHIATINESL